MENVLLRFGDHLGVAVLMGASRSSSGYGAKAGRKPIESICTLLSCGHPAAEMAVLTATGSGAVITAAARAASLRRASSPTQDRLLLLLLAAPGCQSPDGDSFLFCNICNTALVALRYPGTGQQILTPAADRLHR